MERDHQLRGQDYRTGGDAGKRPGSFSVVITGSDLEVCGLTATSSICSTGWWLVVLNHTKPLQTISPSFFSLTQIYAKAARRRLLRSHPSRAHLLWVELRTTQRGLGRVERWVWRAWGQTSGSGRPHLAQLHEEVGDPSLDALPEGIVLGPAGAGGEGSPGPAPPAPRPPRTHRPLHL